MDDQGAVIPDHEASSQHAANAENVSANAHAVAEENVQATRPRTLADYNSADQYDANKSAIRPLSFRGMISN